MESTSQPSLTAMEQGMAAAGSVVRRGNVDLRVQMMPHGGPPGSSDDDYQSDSEVAATAALLDDGGEVVGTTEAHR